ncbi:MAG: hypothetical protein QXS18_05210 [Thermoplasmata archaeon]
MKKKSICVISFSPIYLDARVLRQIKYLSNHYYINVIGYGPAHPDFAAKDDIKWFSIDNENRQKNSLTQNNKINLFKNKTINNKIVKSIRIINRQLKTLSSFLLLCLGRFHPFFYEFWYWKQKYRKKALRNAIESKCNAFHANDWNSLPMAAKAAEILNAKLIFDAHEYAPLELENRWYWKPLFQPMITYFLKKYSSKINASITVAPAISQRYREEFGLNPQVILNTPERVFLKKKYSNSNEIRLVHHGGAIRDRKLENLIKTLAFCDNRFSLHFILLKNDLVYIKSLMILSEKIAPYKIKFYEPVSPERIVERISEYDMGFYLLEPNSFNNIAALPNKFFDFIAAGLAICIGPSPSMAEFVKKYGIGCVAPSFEPKIVAETLNQFKKEDIIKMKEASRKASKYLNAENEMKKLINLYNNILMF